MSNKLLESLLLEYDYKKRKAELDLEERKGILYQRIPRLQEIENEINNLAINNAKNILLKKAALTDLKNSINLLKKEKENILKQNNVSDSFLQPYYECNLCQDTGYIQDSKKGSSLCPCLKQKLLDISYNKSNISNLSRENFDNFDLSVFSNKIDFEKFKLNISPRQNILTIKNKCLDFIQNFDNPDYKNLLFTGNTGLGKTYMSNCIANELIKKRKKCSLPNCSRFT